MDTLLLFFLAKINKPTPAQKGCQKA